MDNVSAHRIGGLRVSVENTRPDISTEEVVSRLGQALGLIDRHTPHYGRHLRRDLHGILVKRYACRGAYFFDSRTCLVELTFCVNPSITLAQIAATLLHEGMHARLHALGVAALERRSGSRRALLPARRDRVWQAGARWSADRGTGAGGSRAQRRGGRAGRG